MRNWMTVFAVSAALFAGANLALQGIDNRFQAIETSKPQLVWDVRQTLSGSVLNCSAAGNSKGWQVADMCRRNLYMRLRQQARVDQFAQCNWQENEGTVTFMCPQGTRI